MAEQVLTRVAYGPEDDCVITVWYDDVTNEILRIESVNTSGRAVSFTLDTTARNNPITGQVPLGTNTLTLSKGQRRRYSALDNYIFETG